MIDLDALELDMRGNAEISLPRDELAALVAIARAAVAWRDVPKERLCIAGSDLYVYCDFLDALREAGL